MSRAIFERSWASNVHIKIWKNGHAFYATEFEVFNCEIPKEPPCITTRDGVDPPFIGVMFSMSTPPVAVNSISGCSVVLHAAVPVVYAHLMRGGIHIWPAARLVSAVETRITNRCARRGFCSLAVGALKIADTSARVSTEKSEGT